MTESSGPWAGTVDTDAGPYSDDKWSDIWRTWHIQDRTVQGPFAGYLGELDASGASSPVALASGGAIVDGKWYDSTASENIVIPTPSVSTRIDRLVLRKSWVNQEVRLTRLAGSEGSGVPPAITQSDGTTWDIPLWRVSITTGGTITLIDERLVAHSRLAQDPAIAEGRLTTVSGTPTPTTDQTAVTTLYYTSAVGDRISLYSPTIGSWRTIRFNELSLSVPATTGTNYDIFIYLDDNLPSLEAVAWTNDTTRASALSVQDGVQVKDSDKRRYLGTFRTTSVSGQTEDSETARLVWNIDNQRRRKLVKLLNSTGWSYGVDVYRALNADTTHNVMVVVGIEEESVELSMTITFDTGGAARVYLIGFGLDDQTVNNADIFTGQSNDGFSLAYTEAALFTGIGFHTIYMVEKSLGADVQNSLGQAAGLIGYIGA